MQSAANITDRSLVALLSEAKRKDASDIHFEPFGSSFRVRLRCDGLLYPSQMETILLSKALLTRIKILAQLDIAQQRLPQDGRLEVTLDDQSRHEYRVSTLPLIDGEKLVLRVIDNQRSLPLDALGFESDDLKLVQSALTRPQGMLIITGPTGSGKSQTLYSALESINCTSRNIATAEDPIERKLEGINQLQLHPTIGLDYPQAIRAFLRQDPDVIMFGEIRDSITAQTAIKAAQTGHLMLSTLHTNSAHETLIRLMNLGVEGFNLGASISLIVAQRLIRLLCPHCKKPNSKGRGFDAHVAGCEHCNGGYKGRTGLFELLPISADLKRALECENLTRAISELPSHRPSLRERGEKLVSAGLTSQDELRRVISL